MSVGYLIEVEKSAVPQRDEALPAGAAGIGVWFQSLLLRAHANRLLKRTLGHPQHLQLDEMPDYLKRDLGLPPYL